ncbi:MAG: glutaredoxin family protein [Frankiaceae bacterium]|nr:glutaredoxin family protein [Arenimonas sp.]
MNLTLFQRDDCPLCDDAHAELLAAGVADFDPVWIDGDAALEAIYGARVPVLRREDTRAELGWPFVAAQVRAFLT